MEIMILEKEASEKLNWIEMACGKKHITVYAGSYTVEVKNHCASSYRLSTGRVFFNIQEAINAYKSSEIKSMLKEAQIQLGRI